MRGLLYSFTMPTKQSWVFQCLSNSLNIAVNISKQQLRFSPHRGACYMWNGFVAVLLHSAGKPDMVVWGGV